MLYIFGIHLEETFKCGESDLYRKESYVLTYWKRGGMCGIHLYICMCTRIFCVCIDIYDVCVIGCVSCISIFICVYIIYTCIHI